MLPSFDEMMKLAQQDPDTLETLRQSWVEDTINSAPDHFQRRLRGLQFQIDMEREKANNPVSACVRISQMMHESVDNLRAVINKEYQPSDQYSEASQPAKKIARVIPFPLAVVD